MLSHLFLGFLGQKYPIFVLMSENWCMSEIRCTSVTAVFIGRRKISWNETFWVNSLTKNLVLRRTTNPKFLVVLTYYLVVQDARTIEFCCPAANGNKVLCLVAEGEGGNRGGRDATGER